ncbi:MAG: transcription factor S [Methanosarcinaceae archaeon]|nr:transcription factor S [Methanosarcinaceae archaeon]
MRFCPKCKSMMFPKNGNFECRKCGHTESMEDKKQESFVSTSKIDEHEVVVLEGEQLSGLPTTRAKCPECGNMTAHWWLRQLRSADESETRFFKCTKCGFTWREYD